MSGCVLSISKSRDSTTSLGNMCQCLVTLAVKQLVLILKLNFNVCAKSHQVGGFLARDGHLDSLQSLAACDKLVPKFLVVWWVTDDFLFLF